MIEDLKKLTEKCFCYQHEPITLLYCTYILHAEHSWLGTETHGRSITMTHLLVGYSSSSSHPRQHHPAICNHLSVLLPMNQPGKCESNANLTLSISIKSRPDGTAQLSYIHFLHFLCYLYFGGTGALKLQALAGQQVKRISYLFIFWHKVWKPPYFNNIV